MFKTIYRILLYLSIVFFLYYLYKLDYFKIHIIHFQIPWLVLSVVFLWIGFIASAISWWNVLKVHQINVNKGKAIYSHGINVFGKYLPGKIWVILGRASIISQNGISLKFTSIISLKEQLIYILLGLIIGYIPFIIVFHFGYLSVIFLLTILLLFFILFSKYLNNLIIKTLSRILKKEFTLPLLSFADFRSISMYILIYWIIWILAFYFFLLASAGDSSFIRAFAFPIGISYGILAVFVPGGLGIREGIMIGFLNKAGMPLDIATTIAILSRIWFISGEIFIFLTALYFKHIRDKYFNRKVPDS